MLNIHEYLYPDTPPVDYFRAAREIKGVYPVHAEGVTLGGALRDIYMNVPGYEQIVNERFEIFASQRAGFLPGLDTLLRMIAAQKIGIDWELLAEQVETMNPPEYDDTYCVRQWSKEIYQGV